MVAGFEKYFQIARCFRDEDPRADRAYGEFTQLDIEKSFTTQEEIQSLIEELLAKLIKIVFPKKKILKIPFPKIPYYVAILKYKSDRPDIREKKDENILAFCWIVDFPAFEWKEQEKKWDATHHPFTAPKKEDLPFLEKGEYEKVRADQYDLVLNGFEVGGGSIRITDPNLQTKIFEIMGHTKKQVEEKFGHLLEAFSYGVPPHGGIALGLDRLLQVILNEKSVREVIAFPASSGGRTAVMDAPSSVDEEQLNELGIEIKNSDKSGKFG
jgi:aspartyl-tRNA synthetase